MSEDQKAARFLPFHAINQFMLPDYRQGILRAVLSALPGLPAQISSRLNQLIKRHVRVPGFRNSQKAPAHFIVKPLADAFEKHSDLAAAVLAAWCETQPTLREQVFSVLSARGWELLPVDTDRTRLPGFFTRWPQGEDYDQIYSAVQSAYPDSESTAYDVSLMAVWLSMRLPYEQFSKSEEAADQEPVGE